MNTGVRGSPLGDPGPLVGAPPSAEVLAAAGDLARTFEGIRLIPYRCPAGFWTVGYGHLVTRDRAAPAPPPVTLAGAETLLEADLSIAYRVVRRNLNVPLTVGQLAALTDFVFNLGGTMFLASTLYRKVRVEDHEDVPTELRRWVYAGGVRLRGLALRREAEIQYYAS